MRILPWASTSISNSQPDLQGSKEDPQIFKGPRAWDVNFFNSYLALLQGHHKQVTSLAVPGSIPAETHHMGVFFVCLFCSEWRQVSRDITYNLAGFFFQGKTLGLPGQPTLSSSLLTTTRMSLTQAWSWFCFQKSHKVGGWSLVGVSGFFCSISSQIHMARIPHALFPFS